jgi:LysM repeat protein
MKSVKTAAMVVVTVAMLSGNAGALNITKLSNDGIAANGTKLAEADKQPDQKKAPEQPAPPAPKMVTVQPGDYLEKIAGENQTTSLRIFYANTDIANPDLIYPNQQLRIPDDSENLTPRDVPVNQQIATPTPSEASSAAAPAPHRAAANYAPGDGSVWDQLAACESGGNWAINTGNGFYGGLQFTLSTWQSLGGSGLPSDASREEQIARAQALQARSGWGQWPACSAKLGL